VVYNGVDLGLPQMKDLFCAEILTPSKGGQRIDKARVPLAAIQEPRRPKQRNLLFIGRLSSVVAMENSKIRLIHDTE